MYAKKEPNQKLMRLARTQGGVLTSSQLNDSEAPVGARRRWIDGWVPMGHGFYCTREPTFESWCWAGMLRAGDTGVITGTAAGHLHGFVKAAPSSITIYHERSAPLSAMGDSEFSIRFRRGARASRGTPRRAVVESTLVDIARESDRNTTIDAIARAVAEGMTTPERVLAALGRSGRVRHLALMRDVCAAASDGVQSILEWLFLKDVIGGHGLSGAQLQVSLVSGTRSDVHFAEFGFVVELDGRLGHEDEPFRDMDRDNRLAARGILTLRFGWHDVVTRPCAVAEQIRAVLELKGLTPNGSRCARCRGVAVAPSL